MVKVLPSKFTLFEQNIFTPPGEPLAITCSDECLFISEEGCLLEVYKLDSLESIAQFRTISPVVQFVYNSKGDCVVTLERKQPNAHGFARVYFNWRGSSVDKPVRVSMMSAFMQGVIQTQDRIAADIVELPAEPHRSVDCLACCEQTGRIAIGMHKTVRVFSLDVDRSGGASCKEYLTHNIQILLDIHTSIILKKVAIFDSYIAFISSCEAQVVKISLLNSGAKSNLKEHHAKEDLEHSKTSLLVSDEIPKDSNFVSWSPSKVWEVELQSGTSSSRGASRGPDLDHVTSGDPQPSSLAQVGTLTLPAISRATLTKSTDRHPTEILGPVEYVWGQPVDVEVENATKEDPKCRLLTMLYRRFSHNVGSEPRVRTASLSVRYTPGMRERAEGGLHSVELIPTVVEDEGGPQLVGISCFLANKYNGYVYDVHQKTKLVSSFSFMSKSTMVSCQNNFMHVLSTDDSVESYTIRAFQAAMANMPAVSRCIPQRVRRQRPRRMSEHREEGDEEEKEEEEEEGRLLAASEKKDVWLKQPCPSPSMDLTLVSSNKFIGACCIATSLNHMIVLTKCEETTPSSADTSTTGWLLQSLSSLRRQPRETSESSWNIYVLKQKHPLSLYQQFHEFADSLKENSPPMYQHILSEGHVLLRGHLTQATPTCLVDAVSALQDNCFNLADSLCAYPTSKEAIAMATRYLILSGLTVAEVFQHVSGNYSKPSCTAYSVLMKYLNLVLFENENITSQAQWLLPMADKILDFYAEQDPKQLTHLLLYSWLREYSTEKALVMLDHRLQLASSPEESYLGHLCQAVLHVRSGQLEEGRERLSEVPDDFLVRWMGDNLHSLVDSSSSQPQQLTTLGKVLLSARERCLLDVLSQSLTSAVFTFEVVCDLLEVHRQSELADNVSLKQFLEGIILGRVEAVGEETVMRAVLLLVEVLFARLSASHVPRPSSSSPFSLYGSRHKWLDTMTPFDGVATSPGKPSQSILQDLMQLQALLCSQHMSAEVGSCVERLLVGGGEEELTVGGNEEGLTVGGTEEELTVGGREEMVGGRGEMVGGREEMVGGGEEMVGGREEMVGGGEEMVGGREEMVGGGEEMVGGGEEVTGALSLKLLTWPHTGKMTEATHFVLDSFPSVTVDYCLTFFESHLEQWEGLLEALLKRIEKGSSPELQNTYHTVYKGVLSHVVTLTSPEEFLDLLPPGGSLDFFLPFMEHSCKLFVSHQVVERLNTSITNSTSS